MHCLNIVVDTETIRKANDSVNESNCFIKSILKSIGSL